MATPVNYSAEFTVDSERLYQTLIDQTYWKDRVAEVGGEGATVGFDPEGDPEEIGWFAVELTHVIPKDKLPPIVTKLRNGDLHIERSEHWGPLTDGAAAGWFTVSIPGTPAQLRGDSRLDPTATGGSKISYSGEAKVSIPFIGAKVESTLSEQVIELLDRERDFTTRWLANHA